MSGTGEHDERVLRRGAFRRLWGAGPLHLLGHVALILVAGYALAVMFEQRFAPRPWNLILWLLGGAVLHDAVFLPAYSGVNKVVARIVGADETRRVPVLGYLRTPAVVAGVLLIVFAPRIFDGQPQNFERALGHPPADYMARWLWVTAGLFAASALLYGIRWLRAPRAPSGAASPDPGVSGSAADAAP